MTQITRAIDSAVSFAAKMIREGKYMGTAIRIAASYYQVDRSDVQKGLASRSGRAQKGRKQTPKPVRMCDNGCESEVCWKLTVGFSYATAIHYYTCEECGQNPPAHAEFGSGHEAATSSNWTAYKPTKAAV